SVFVARARAPVWPPVLAGFEPREYWAGKRGIHRGRTRLLRAAQSQSRLLCCCAMRVDKSRLDRGPGDADLPGIPTYEGTLVEPAASGSVRVPVLLEVAARNYITRGFYLARGLSPDRCRCHYHCESAGHLRAVATLGPCVNDATAQLLQEFRPPPRAHHVRRPPVRGR